MTVLLILNRNPYDGTDVTWNALRLAQRFVEDAVQVRLFLVNEGVDLARDGIQPPEGFFDLVAMVKELIEKGVLVKACGTCQARCGIRKGDPYYEGVEKSSMADLSEWVQTSHRVLSF